MASLATYQELLQAYAETRAAHTRIGFTPMALAMGNTMGRKIMEPSQQPPTKKL